LPFWNRRRTPRWPRPSAEALGGTDYGGFARRCLTAPEAAIFRHDAA